MVTREQTAHRMSSLWWLGTAVQAAREDGFGLMRRLATRRQRLRLARNGVRRPAPKMKAVTRARNFTNGGANCYWEKGISLFARRLSGLMLAFGANRRIPACSSDCA